MFISYSCCKPKGLQYFTRSLYHKEWRCWVMTFNFSQNYSTKLSDYCLTAVEMGIVTKTSPWDWVLVVLLFLGLVTLRNWNQLCLWFVPIRKRGEYKVVFRVGFIWIWLCVQSQKVEMRERGLPLLRWCSCRQWRVQGVWQPTKNRSANRPRGGTFEFGVGEVPRVD